MHGDGVGWSGDSKLKEANMSSNSERVDEVTEMVAASMLARHLEIASSLERTSSGYSTCPSWPQATAESRSS